MKAARLALAVALVTTLGATTACDEEEPDCTRPADLPVTGVGNTTVLLDVTASTRSAGPAPNYAGAVADALGRAVDRGDVVSIGTFDGSAATVAWTVENYPTASMSKRDSNRKRDRETARGCLGRTAGQAATTPARTNGTDVLGAMGVAATHTRLAGDQRRTVVVATDGLSTAGCADLSRGPVGKPQLIDAAASDCPKRPDWPTSLAGVHLTMVGVGHPADGQPVLETGHLAWLQQYWERLCLVVGAASCEVSTAPVAVVRRGDTVAASTVPLTDPVVRFTPGAGPPTPPVERKTYNVDSAALFPTDSDEVGQAGRKRLAEITEQIKDTSVTALEVIGYTDSRSSPGHNQALSQRRAAAVGRELTALGLPAPKTRGAGETGRLCPQEKLPDGSWDEACLQRNRRVEIVITTESG
ncbi:OmpA family protein [Micromonospora purpureochromogenes]|uniref:OOP family OmpA-OmpF porin n=1 Tax=Micromonospora purpureochromogenes TaxID=47872 RepID=A0ABX2RPQ8_9ACTN|nr:OmpA family protein [Micromonospora purpureochromogenes]NYF57146.1 OOP family OmpA-OmpF porin [Micromonospora purpureochromogenes]